MIEFVCLAVSLGIFFFLWKSRFNYLLLGRLPVSENQTAPDLTVIIPARNEAHQIPNAIQSFPGIPVIVVDDASNDNTAAVSQAAGATVIPAPALTLGNLGKPNACAAGAALAKTKWLLFVDAGTTFDPRFAASAVRHAEQNNYDLLTAFLERQCITPFEKMLLPYSLGLYFAGVSARAINLPGNSSALANGQCLLFRRAPYERIGGHAKVITSAIEDVALAQLAKSNNLSVRVLRAEHLGSVRVYNSLHARPIGGIQVILASIFLTSWLPALILGLGDYPSPLTVPLLLSPTPVLLLFLTPFLTLTPWYAESHSTRIWRVVLAPVAIYVFLLITLKGMFVTILRRTVDWKARRV